MAREMDMAHISSGDLFRQAVERGDELGRKVKAYMEKGALVPDEITIQMVLDRLAQPSKQKGIILDGFPRNLAQAESLDKALTRPGESRELGGLHHGWPSPNWCGGCPAAGCAASARHLTRVDGAGDAEACQKCGGELYQRADDSPETVQEAPGGVLPGNRAADRLLPPAG